MRLRFLFLFLSAFACASAQDIHLNVYYVCDVGRVMVEGCEIGDTSDKGECFVEYTDKINANGSPSMKSVPRGELKKYLASCKQPGADAVSRADAFRKRQQDQQDATQQKNLAMMKQPANGADPRYKGPEERQMARCLTSGRLPASCLGNQLSTGFAEFMQPGVEMANQVLGTSGKNAISLEPITGPYMSGVYTGPGAWYLDFTDENVQMKCSDVSPWPDKYTVEFRPSGAFVTVQVNPHPVVLAVHGDGKTLTGPPGAVVLDGFVPDGRGGGGSAGHYETSTTTTHQELTGNEATQYGGQSNLTDKGEGTYDLATTHTSTNYVGGGGMPNRPTYHAKRVTCPALNLSNTGAGIGEKTIETNFLKSMMGSGTGAPTPPGIRINGIYANNSTGFSAQFFPESVILGCGPDVAKAYPYSVAASGGHAVIHVEAPDHPLTLTLTGTTMDAGTGTYQVHGRTLLGRQGDDFAYAPAELSCALGPLEASKTIPMGGGNAAGAPVPIRAAGTPGAATAIATAEAPTGNAVLRIVNGFPPASAAQFAGHGFALLRTSFIQAEMNAGATKDPNASPYMVMGQACGTHSPMCQQISESVKAQSASSARADATGSATLPGVPPGRYYLLISIRMNNESMAWLNPVELKSGTNTFTLTPSNAMLVR